MTPEKQLKVLIKNQRQIIEREKDPLEKAKTLGFSIGFLNGMRLTNCLTPEEYQEAYESIMESKYE